MLNKNILTTYLLIYNTLHYYEITDRYQISIICHRCKSYSEQVYTMYQGFIVSTKPSVIDKHAVRLSIQSCTQCVDFIPSIDHRLHCPVSGHFIVTSDHTTMTAARHVLSSTRSVNHTPLTLTSTSRRAYAPRS